MVGKPSKPGSNTSSGTTTTTSSTSTQTPPSSKPSASSAIKHPFARPVRSIWASSQSVFNRRPRPSIDMPSTDPGREQGREPTSEEREPPVYENGINTGANLGDALDVEEIDVNLYKSKALWRPARARGVFGGQVIGQSVAAANATVRDNVRLHCYFLLAGDATIPIIYTVTRVRDGGSYVTRSVRASQRGRSIFEILVSYQVPEPDEPRFAIPLPRADDDDHLRQEESASLTSTTFSRSPTPNSVIAGISPPEQCQLNEERYLRVLREKEGMLPEQIVTLLQSWVRDRQESAVEIRDALPGMYDENGLPTPGYEQAFWMRTRKPVEGGQEAQKAALAYASDFYLLSNVPKALGNSRNIKMMASLDHSMWFYDTFDCHHWLLFVMQTQAASNGRGIAMGRFYREDGTLVAVVVSSGRPRGRPGSERPAGLTSSLIVSTNVFPALQAQEGLVRGKKKAGASSMIPESVKKVIESDEPAKAKL